MLESTFLEAGSGWQDVGAAKGSNAVDSGCVLESTFLEAGSGWQDIGAAKGSNAVYLGCHPVLSILCSFSTAPHAPPHPQPPECTFFPLEIFLIAASRETCLPHFL